MFPMNIPQKMYNNLIGVIVFFIMQFGVQIRRPSITCFFQDLNSRHDRKLKIKLTPNFFFFEYVTDQKYMTQYWSRRAKSDTECSSH